MITLFLMNILETWLVQFELILIVESISLRVTDFMFLRLNLIKFKPIIRFGLVSPVYFHRKFVVLHNMIEELNVILLLFLDNFFIILFMSLRMSRYFVEWRCLRLILFIFCLFFQTNTRFCQNILFFEGVFPINLSHFNVIFLILSMLTAFQNIWKTIIQFILILDILFRLNSFINYFFIYKFHIIVFGFRFSLLTIQFLKFIKVLRCIYFSLKLKLYIL